MSTLRQLDDNLRGFSGSVVLLVDHGTSAKWFSELDISTTSWTMSHESALLVAQTTAGQSEQLLLDKHTEVVVAKVLPRAFEEDNIQAMLPRICSLTICVATDKPDCGLTCAHSALQHVVTTGKSLRSFSL